MFQSISDDRFEDTARHHERQLKVAVLERAAAVHERLLENGTQLCVVHEFETAPDRRLAELPAAASQLLELTEREVALRAQGVIHGMSAAGDRRSDRCVPASPATRLRRRGGAAPPPRPRVL